MDTYNIGDFIYATDEHRVYEVKTIPNENTNYYNCTIAGGSATRGFKPDAINHRPASLDEIEAAKRYEKVVKVKVNTEAYDMIYKAFHYKDKWDENKEKIEAFLGFPKEGNLYHSVDSLYINPRMVKEEWKDQFKKNSSPAQAKSGSKINKAWKALCKELGLEVHDLRDFQFKYALHFIGFQVHNFDDEYYVEFKGDGLLGRSLFEWAEPISEPEFLRIKASFLEKEST